MGETRDLPQTSAGDTLLLVQKAQEGDQKALNALFSRFAPFVERIVSILLNYDSVADADEYVQECLLKAFRGLGRFRTDEGQKDFRAWLRVIARSVILDERKKWKRLKRGGKRERLFSEIGSTYLSSSILPAAHGETPSEVAMAREAKELEAERDRQVETALRKLREHHRELILMHDYCECSWEEMAANLQTNKVDAVRKAYYRAREALTATLA